MGVLFPWFLAGLVAIAAPIIYHFRQKQTKDITKFSSLMFLETVPIKQRTQSQIQHWLLLIVRCLIFALLAFAFARPFLSKAVAVLDGESPEKVVVLVDKSASMKRDGLWDAALEKVQAIVNGLKPADVVQVSAFDSSISTVFTFADSKATGANQSQKILEELKELEPSWEKTNLGRALVGAAEAIEQIEDEDESIEAGFGEAEGRVIVVSDAHEGADIDQLKSFLWPEKIQLEFENLKPDKPTNASIQLLPEAKGISHVAKPSRYFRIENGTASKTDMFTVRWRNADDTAASEALTVKVLPGEKAVLKAPDTATGLPAPILELAGDDHGFDNRAYTEAVAAKQLRILYVGSEPDNDPQTALFFLRRALFPTRTVTPELTKKLPDDTFEADVLRLFDLIVISGEGPLPNASLFRNYVEEDGGRVLFLMHDAASAEGLGGLLGIDGLAAQEGEVRDYRLLGGINRRHPLLAAFADARYGDFSNVHFWKYRKIDAEKIPGAGILAKFDNGDPAWILTPKGKGTVLTFTSSWKRPDSQLALSTKFIPLLYSVLSNQAEANNKNAVVHVGEPFPVNAPVAELEPAQSNNPTEPAEDSDNSDNSDDSDDSDDTGDGEESATEPAKVNVTITYPSGKTVPFIAGDSVFRETTEPGLYTVKAGEVTSIVAVNLNPDESELDPLDTDVVRKMVEPEVVEEQEETVLDENATQSEKDAQEIRALNVEKEKRQRLWRYLVFAALALLLFEIWYSAYCRKKELKSQETEA